MNHYKHRPAPISWAWAIHNNDQILGVLTVGKPVAWSTCAGLVGEKKNPTGGRQKDVYELNRLWIDDSLPKNTESQFVGWCLRKLRKERPRIILVSYADTAQKNPKGQAHRGVVYQATNWLYTGTSASFKDKTYSWFQDYRSVPLTLRGPNNKGRRLWPPLVNPSTGQLEKAVLIERSKKHRYVWFSDPEDQKLLHWPILPYPRV